MPYIKLPTADNEIGNDKVEGGIIFPFSTNVSDAINLDLMFETDFQCMMMMSKILILNLLFQVY